MALFKILHPIQMKKKIINAGEIIELDEKKDAQKISNLSHVLEIIPEKVKTTVSVEKPAKVQTAPVPPLKKEENKEVSK